VRREGKGRYNRFPQRANKSVYAVPTDIVFFISDINYAARRGWTFDEIDCTNVSKYLYTRTWYALRTFFLFLGNILRTSACVGERNLTHYGPLLLIAKTAHRTRKENASRTSWQKKTRLPSQRPAGHSTASKTNNEKKTP
jgi:hypothetical protein